MKYDLPEGRVLVYGGDICGSGTVEEVESFNLFLQENAHKYDKIFVIAGNHDWCFQTEPDKAIEALTKDLTDKVIYLKDEEYVYEGVKLYGSPYQPEFCSWAFNVKRGPLLAAIWSQIPEDVDVLITHGPPAKILDFTLYDREHAGCVDLMNRIVEIRPKVHCFGHIHEGYGTHFDGQTWYLNCSVCTLGYVPKNAPHIMDYDEETKEWNLIMEDAEQ